MSNFHPAKFKVGNDTYYHSEQFYQQKKAEYFKDDVCARKILIERDPLQCMKLGFRVKKFDQKVWDQVAKNYMIDGNTAKFMQNPSLRDQLLATGDKVLAESSPDPYWGTGQPIYSKVAFSKTTWSGSNHHGEGLMLIRERLRQK